MKIRMGLVSNSSSSSFILVIKHYKVDLKSKLNNIFKLPENHPFNFLNNQDYFLLFKNKMELIENIRKEDWDNYTEKEVEYFLKYYQVFNGFFADDGDFEETLLCESEIHYEDDDIIIEKEGGY
jgi:hypothetical protein